MVSLPKNPRVFSNMAFKSAYSKLNQYNLSDLWCVSCTLSCVEYYDALADESGVNALFPMINFEKIDMFAKAILASSSRDYKNMRFDSYPMAKVFNSLVDATYTDELSEVTKDPDHRLMNFFARKANSQFRRQRYLIKTSLARAYALYQHIPNQYHKKLADKHKRNYIDIPAVFQSKTGITIAEYLLIGFTLFGFYLKKYSDLLQPSDELRSEVSRRRAENCPSLTFQSRLLAELIDESTYFREKLTFFPRDLLIRDNDQITCEKITCFLRLVSKTSQELSLLSHQKPYNKGELVYRLCPLERYPVLELADGKYIIPNLRFFDGALTNVIHFSFQDWHPDNQFNDTFGSVYEFYVRDYAKSRLCGCDLIPETRYKRGKQWVDGPDLTLIDTEKKSLILIEVKSKNVRLETRISPFSSRLPADLGRALDALEKLPTKLEEIYKGLPEYAEWQDKINSTDKRNTLCFVAIGRGVHFMPEILDFQRRSDPKHFLNSFPYAYGVLEGEHLEHALELVYRDKSTFYDLLKSYWESSTKTGVKEDAAQNFGGLTIGSEDVYLNQFADLLFVTLKNSDSK